MEVGACLSSGEAGRVSSQHVSYRAVGLFLVKEDNNDPSWPVTGPCEGTSFKRHFRALQSPGLDVYEKDLTSH